MALGLLVIYASGTLWLASVTGRGGAASSLVAAVATGVAPFVVADLAKLAGAAGIVPGLWRLFGTEPRKPRT
jgi:biotin transport system substrate-specific component